MKKIYDEEYPEERALYGVEDTNLYNCRFAGKEDGESALKEAKNIYLESCYMDLRYPLWHTDTVRLCKVSMTNNCRAPLWYAKNIEIEKSKILGVKAIRESQEIKLVDTLIDSTEFGWKSHNIRGKKLTITSEYAFFEAEGLQLENIDFFGKYSFQYVKNMVIEDSSLNTKDAFWHTKNVTVKNTTVIGEYLGWYSENLTFINCKIVGTQPLCYCKDLKLIDCEMQDTDLAFEYSSVNASIKGSIDSVKNPISGEIIADEIKDVLITGDSKFSSTAKITIRSKE